MDAISVNSIDWQAALKESNMSLTPSFVSVQAEITTDGHKERFDKVLQAAVKPQK